MIIGKKLGPKGILKKSQDLIRQRGIIDMLSIFWIMLFNVVYENFEDTKESKHRP